MRRCSLPLSGTLLTLAVGLLFAGSVQANDQRPHAGMLRYPDISDTDIVFVYANDLWVVARDGGVARPLASPPGEEGFARFSPDGHTIAFVGNYDGNRDLYTIPVNGGVPHRVTYHPAGETLCDWTPDGSELTYSARGTYEYPRASELFTIAAGGGLRTKMPVPYGANAAISADGQWLAYTPHTRDQRTWKRYRGGMATDIWLFNLKTHNSRKITDWEGTDSLPMWRDATVYYLSDAGPSHRLNIWSFDTASGARKQITTYSDSDVKWPAIGGDRIVYQLGTDLMTLDLSSLQSRKVDVVVPGDRPKIRPRSVNAHDNLAGGSISAKGKRAVVQARGDVWTLPAKHGSPRNLSRTNGAAERDPSWSPDGQWIAYFCDGSGEYELYITQSDGKGETKKRTDGAGAYLYSPTWSPDSKWIAYSDKGARMFLYNIDDGATREFDVNPLGGGGGTQFSWAGDSNWIAYAKGNGNHLTSIWLYNVEKNEKHKVTSHMFNDTQPAFDREGKYLYYASNRDFTAPTYEDIANTFVYNRTDRLIVVPLRDEVGSPFAPKSDEEKWGDQDEDDEDKDKDKDKDKDDGDDKTDKDDGDHSKGDGDADGDNDDGDDDAKATKDDDADDGDADDEDDEQEEPEPVEIEIDGFERRGIILPVDRGSFGNLAVNNKNHLLYVRGGVRGGGRGEKSAIKIFDVAADKPEEKTVLDDAGGFDISADGKKILVGRGAEMAIVEAKADQKFEDKLTSNLTVTIDPRAEWPQLFREAWRVQRDFFYDPHMHGVDWDGVYAHYAPMIADCASREDVSYVIREMIAELNVGHAYYFGGDTESQPSVSVGMLGCDFELDSGAYRVSRIVEGADWDADARGPLSQPGVDIDKGDYLLAVNGAAIDATKSPWAAFQAMAGDTVTLTVNAKPTLDGDEREVVVKLQFSENGLRYRAWIEKNRRYVDEQSGGKVGYIYVPDTGTNGQNDLFRQFYGQSNKPALIIDERWNGGGQIPDRFVELLNRPVRNYWAVRDGQDWSWPPNANFGAKCMLINGLAGSGGDCFPHYFRQSGVGKLIGTRTWGGLVGISGNPGLIDGGYTSAPTFAFYESDGTWGIEGHGVDPDIEVVDDPALMVGGKDPQLDRAIALMLEEASASPYQAPSRPQYPDRSGMGILEKDK